MNPRLRELDDAVVLVIGLGEVGRPLLEVLEPFHAVIGRDLEDVLVDDVGVLHICFPFSEAFVELTSRYVSAYRPSLVIVNSTVVPGTSRAIENCTGVPTVYSPVRGKHFKMKDDVLAYDKFIAGTSGCAVGQAERHFKMAGLVTQRMSSPEALEVAKLLETSYFGLLIAWAQEMDRFATALSADYDEILEFFRRGRRVAVNTFPAWLYRWPLRDAQPGTPRRSAAITLHRGNPSLERERECEWRSLGKSLADRHCPP